MQAPQHAAAQVLNMKPQEILGMLEEAAGTRMYETKKEAALRTLEKKQVKVQEIEKVLFPVRLTQEHFAWQGLPIPIDLRVLSKQAERLLFRPCLTTCATFCPLSPKVLQHHAADRWTSHQDEASREVTGQ